MENRKRKIGFFFLSFLPLSCLPACTPLFVPPLRQTTAAPVTLDLAGSAGLRRRGEGLELSLQLSQVPEAGWLAVQWYSPTNRLLTSESKWIEPNDVGLSLSYVLPARFGLAPGDWRAVVSSEDAFLRQFSLVIDD